MNVQAHCIEELAASWEGTGCGWVADQRKECTIGRYGSRCQNAEVRARAQEETGIFNRISK